MALPKAIEVTIQKESGVSVHEYAVRIRREMSMTIDTVMRIGRTLTQAKEDFKNQQEGGELESAKQAYKDLLEECNLTANAAQRLIYISSKEFLLKCQKKSQLPQGWSILHRVAQLPELEFEHRLKSGEINPKLSQKEVLGWLSTKKSISRSKNKKKSITYEPVTIDSAHDCFVRLAKKDKSQCIEEIVNLAADSGIDIKTLITELEKIA